ncbi:MAG: EthD family reductase [Gaiellaceae bacterium]
MSLVRRNPELSRTDFLEHWMGTHAEIVKQLPGVRGLRFGVVEEWTPPESGWDGVGEVWFDSIEEAETAFATEPYHSLLAEDRKLLFEETQACFVVEHTAISPPA